MHFFCHSDCHKFGVLNWARFSYITTPHPSIDLAYLVQGHTLKSAPDGSIIFFFSGYVNEILLPNLGLRLYKSHDYTLEWQPIEEPRRSSVSGRMTRSRSRNAAMDMPPPPPQAFHGYAGHVPAGGMIGSSSGQQSGWDRYVPQPKAGGSSWKSTGSKAVGCSGSFCSSGCGLPSPLISLFFCV